MENALALDVGSFKWGSATATGHRMKDELERAASEQRFEENRYDEMDVQDTCGWIYDPNKAIRRRRSILEQRSRIFRMLGAAAFVSVEEISSHQKSRDRNRTIDEADSPRVRE